MRRAESRASPTASTEVRGRLTRGRSSWARGNTWWTTAPPTKPASSKQRIQRQWLSTRLLPRRPPRPQGPPGRTAGTCRTSSSASRRATPGAVSRIRTFDTTPPTTASSLAGTAGANGWYVSNVTVSLTATDLMSGVAAANYRIDNGSWLAYAGPILLSDGRHLLEYGASDVA